MTPSCAASCPDGGIPASCGGPADCKAGSACCITATASFVVDNITCAEYDNCVPKADTSQILTRACKQNSDCTTTDGSNTSNNNTQFPTCCTHVASQQHVCLSAAAALLTQGAFTCP
jgi:hypothetical protein